MRRVWVSGGGPRRRERAATYINRKRSDGPVITEYNTCDEKWASTAECGGRPPKKNTRTV